MPRPHRPLVTCAILLLALLPCAVARGADGSDSLELELGRRIYVGSCAACHGRRGDGQGPGARFLDPAPRDFTSGVYKFRSTLPGQLPTEEDLLRVISRGMPGTAMPGWEGQIPESERRAVARYILELAPAAMREASQTPLVVGEAPTSTDEQVALGRQVYERAGCVACHGEQGRGDGPTAKALKDTQGIQPRDLVREPLRGGAEVSDIYRTVSTGIGGTPMPPYVGFPEEERWALARYVLSIRRRGGPIVEWLRGPTAGWE